MRPHAESSSSADVLAALRACRLWRDASDDAVAPLAARVTVQSARPGALLAVEGDPAERFGVVVEGTARVYYLGADGRQITFETAGPGEPLAAVAALAGGRYPATVEASTPITVAWLPRSALLDLLSAEPRVSGSLIADLASRVVNLTSVVQTLALDVPSRLARYLFQRALSTGHPTESGLGIDLGMPKGELARALGTVPETLSRAFGKLKADGIIAVDRASVTILDMRGLAERASGLGDG